MEIGHSAPAVLKEIVRRFGVILKSQFPFPAVRHHGESACLVAKVGAQQVAAADDHAPGHLLSRKVGVGVVAAELGRWALGRRRA